MNLEQQKQAAAILALNRVRVQTMDGLPEDARPADETEAYEVQEQLHSLLDEAGYGKRVGYKIGCTTPVMQEFLGIANPCAGGVFNTSTNYIATSAQYQNFSHPGVECEIAAFIGTDLTPAAECGQSVLAILRRVGVDRVRPAILVLACAALERVQYTVATK